MREKFLSFFIVADNLMFLVRLPLLGSMQPNIILKAMILGKHRIERLCFTQEKMLSFVKSGKWEVLYPQDRAEALATLQLYTTQEPDNPQSSRLKVRLYTPTQL